MEPSSRQAEQSKRIHHAIRRNDVRSQKRDRPGDCHTREWIQGKGDLKKLALPRWTAGFPEGFSGLAMCISESKYLRPKDTESDNFLVQFRQGDKNIVLYNKYGVQISSEPLPAMLAEPKEFHSIVQKAEQIARAQYLLNLECNDPQYQLAHDVKFKVGIVEDGSQGRAVTPEGGGSLPGEAIYIHLKNSGKETVYAYIFDVTGNITLITSGNPRGLQLNENEEYLVGEDEFSLDGLPISWPSNVPKTRPVPESLVFIFASSPMDLRHLERSSGKEDQLCLSWSN